MNFDTELYLSIIYTLSNSLRLSSYSVFQIIKSVDTELKTSSDFVRFFTIAYPSLPALDVGMINKAEELISKHSKNNIHCISIFNSRYPQSLRLIKNPPIILYAKGNISLLQDNLGVAIVGTRQVTPNGAIIAERLAKFLSSINWTVVSGLALGVDGHAHTGAYADKGKTIAVLASGLHKASPKKNEILADEILLNGGLWVSEHPIGVEPRKEFFVPRNRIQIGLSAGSIIIESNIKSGTATQADFCIESERPLFAVVPQYPDNPLGLLAEGPMHLVKDKGAIPIKSKADYPHVVEILQKSANRIRALSGYQQHMS